MHPDVDIRLRDDPSPDELAHVSRHFRAYNDKHGGRFPSKDIHLFAYGTDGEVVGGLFGDISWGWLHVDVIWVADGYRRQGIGSSLMDRSEVEAVAMGVHSAYLETTDFQALGFYKRRGYEVFAKLDDQPPGHVCYYLKNDDLGDHAAE
ncbi:MAG: GNAT family N-acetyltransferase [Acidimicrobiia bacterium]